MPRVVHMPRGLTLALGAALVALIILVSCSPAGFDAESLIESVRILASRSDQPYALPGATVRSQVLAVDGRPDAAGNAPMQIHWLPFLCINPPDDAYYGCFSELAGNQAIASALLDGGGPATLSTAISAWDGGPDAGVTGGSVVTGDAGLSLLRVPAGVDLDSFLINGDKVVFNLPSNIISSHSVVKGVTPYGVAIAFNIACAGHVEALPPDPNNLDPVQSVVGCFNAQHEQLTANDYVIGYAEVFAYDHLTNHNPVIDSLVFQSSTLGLDGGVAGPVTFAHCSDSNTANCPNLTLGVNVPDASQEPDPRDLGTDGGPLGE
jgi:hypothetical protein